MSGGIAYVLDLHNEFEENCNMEMVSLQRLQNAEEIEEVKQMILNHGEYTDSHLAWKVLAKWDEMQPKFVKVMPIDFERMLVSIEEAKLNGSSGEQAVMDAFLQNKEEKARAEGN